MSHEQKQETENKYSTGKKHIRAKKVAKYIGVGLFTVWLYCQQGKLTAKKINARVTVFSIDEISDLVNNVEVA